MKEHKQKKLDGTRDELVCEMRCEGFPTFQLSTRNSSKKTNNRLCASSELFS